MACTQLMEEHIKPNSDKCPDIWKFREQIKVSLYHSLFHTCKHLETNSFENEHFQADKELNEVVGRYHKKLAGLFAKYSGANQVTGMRDDSSVDIKVKLEISVPLLNHARNLRTPRTHAGLSLQEFEIMLSEKSAFCEMLTKRQIFSLFVMARDENYINDSYSLRFPSFVELLLRSALSSE